MTINYTANLGLALPVQGTESGVWGDVVNNSITTLVDSAVAGTTTLSADADVTLTTTTGTANQARQAIILWTANGSVTRNITAPALTKWYVVINKTAGSQSIVLRGVGPTAGVTIVNGEKAICAWNGTDFVKVGSTVALPAGSTTQVQYNLSGVLTGSANMTFNGTTLSATGFAGPMAATTLSASSTVSGAGFSTYLASPPAIGGTAPAAGAFTTLSASSTVSGAGFSTYLASPPAIGGTAAAAGAFTTLSATSTVSGTGFTNRFASPGPIGNTAASTGAFTTLSASSTVSGSGFDAYLASPPAIGGTAPASITTSLLALRNGTEGRVRILTGGASNTGYIEFQCATTFVRQGYIGYGATTASADAGDINYIAGNHAFTGNPSGTIASGSWTPTYTNNNNTNTFTLRSAKYIRVGNHVSFSVSFTLSLTAAGSGNFYLTLPIASNFTSTNADVAGTCTADVGVNTPQMSGVVVADTAGDRLWVLYSTNTTSSLACAISGHYVIQ